MRKIESREEAIALADHFGLALMFGIEFPTAHAARMPGYISHAEAFAPIAPGHRWTRCIVNDVRRPSGDKCRPRFITVYEDGAVLAQFVRGV